jgi:hypothetical protein
MKYDLLLKLASLPLEEHLENSMTFGAMWVEKPLLKTQRDQVVSLVLRVRSNGLLKDIV